MLALGKASILALGELFRQQVFTGRRKENGFPRMPRRELYHRLRRWCLDITDARLPALLCLQPCLVCFECCFFRFPLISSFVVAAGPGIY